MKDHRKYDSYSQSDNVVSKLFFMALDSNEFADSIELWIFINLMRGPEVVYVNDDTVKWSKLWRTNSKNGNYSVILLCLCLSHKCV